jgi:hypothetical protein
MVPYEVHSKSNTGLKITSQQRTIAAASLIVVGAAPAIFTVEATGVGQEANL